jgi:hypothetical protein
MSMPKGFKSSQGYATVTDTDGGMDYRTIAQKMTDDGHKMNHATARNIFLRAMKKLAEPLCEMYETSGDPSQIERTARDPRFQSGMIELINEVYEDDGKIDI